MTNTELEHKIWRLQERAGDLESMMLSIKSKHWDSDTSEMNASGQLRYEKIRQKLALVEAELSDLEKQYEVSNA